MNNLQIKLFRMQDKEYQKFQSNLCPGIDNIIGVRMPDLKKLAKNLSKDKNIINYLNENDEEYYEEVMLKGLIIGYLNLELNEIFELLKKFIPKINNWAICDLVVSNLKIVKNHKKETFQFIKPYLFSDNEFTSRFAIVILLNYYIDDEYIDMVLENIEKIKLDKYYTKMAIAWILSICYIKYKEKTYEFLKEAKLNKWIYNKTLQKIIESNKVLKHEKEEIRLMKIK